MRNIEMNEVLGAIRDRGSAGLTMRALTDRFADGATDRSEVRRVVRNAVRALEREGRVIAGRGKRYFAAEHSRLVVGRVRSKGKDRLVHPRDGGDPLLLPRRNRSGAIDGDLVTVRVERPRKGARDQGLDEATVVTVVQRGRREVVGLWLSERGAPMVRPLDHKLGFLIQPKTDGPESEPRHGEVVVMALDAGPRGKKPATGRVVERIGRFGEPGVEEAAGIRLFQLPDEFSPEVLAEADRLSAEVAADSRRWDLRDRPVVTIDPPDARDFDDAVNAAPTGNGGINVEVHIADVGRYVRPGATLDASAKERGTSVYLPGRCVPMLPERLSNDLCSLREGVDRHAYTVRFIVDSAGAIGKVATGASVIRSRARLEYDQVLEWLETPAGDWPEETAPFAESLRLLDEAARRLRRRRVSEGGLDFDLAEAKTVLDMEGRLVDIEARHHHRAHRLIEDLMIAANRSVARKLIRAGQPALHRVHPPPASDDLEELTEVLEELGYSLSTSDDGVVSPAELQRVIDAAEGTPEERLVSMLVLRSMMQAYYSPEPTGHWALGTDAYTHFTSPIRRYPDLVAHRALRALDERGGPPDGEHRQSAEDDLEELGRLCSDAERRAESAERTVLGWKKVLYLSDREGESFAGHVTGVTEFGLFVELDEVQAEGLVHVSDLGEDYYELASNRHALIGRRTNDRWRLGDAIVVRLARADLQAMRLDFDRPRRP